VNGSKSSSNSNCVIYGSRGGGKGASERGENKKEKRKSKKSSAALLHYRNENSRVERRVWGSWESKLDHGEGKKGEIKENSKGQGAVPQSLLVDKY